MKRLILIMVLLIIASFSSAQSDIWEAIHEGEDFIRDNAKPGHKGIMVEDFDVAVVQAFENDLYYRFVYKLSSNIFGETKERYVMIEMEKHSREIVDVYVSESKRGSSLL